MRIWYFQVGWGELPVWSMAKSRRVHILTEKGWVRGKSPSRVRDWSENGGMSPLSAYNAMVPGHMVKKKGFEAWLMRRVQKLPVSGGFLAIGINREYEKDYGELKVHVMHDLRTYPSGEPSLPDLPARIS